MYKQTIYMNQPQLKAYLEDLSIIDSANMMGGMNGKLLHGKEVADIHDLANKIRERSGAAPVDFPSKSFTAAIIDFFAIPFHILVDRK